MNEQIETAYPAETLFLWTVTKPAKRLLGIAATVGNNVEETTTEALLQ